MSSRLTKQNGLCLGYVIMPDHVHALIWFPVIDQLGPFMDKWKEMTSKTLKQVLPTAFPNYWNQIDERDPIWQARYYGFNIWSRSKVEEKLNYMHENPVRAGLVQHPTDWQWSSARWYFDRKTVGVPIRWPPGLEEDDDFAVT